MQFCALTKTGVHIYDALSFSKPTEGFEDGEGKDEAIDNNKPIFSLPASTNSEGYVSSNSEGFAWSPDGANLVTVDKGTVVCWNCEHGYRRTWELTPAGSSGGVRAIRFSPAGHFLITYEKFDREKCPENMQVWDLRKAPTMDRARLQTLKGYSSGVVPIELLQWPVDESICLELLLGKGIVALQCSDLQPEEPPRFIPEPAAVHFQIAPRPQNGACYVACYVPEAAGRAAEVVMYHMSSPGTPSLRYTLPPKLKSVSLMWNPEGSAVLALSSSDVDETGASYFGTTSLVWIRADGKGSQQIAGPEDGLVQDVAWSPTGNEFLLIVGMLPATISLYDGKTGKHVSTLGKSKRNTIRWDPFGRLLAVGGFGALPGDLEFFDKAAGETVCSFRSALTVNCCWGPDGRHFLACTTAPRMNEDNQVSVYRYTGERILKQDFRPVADAGGGRKAADAGAMLFASSWRPDFGSKHKDRPLSPPKAGSKRPKGLPAEGPGTTSSGPKATAAYRPAAARGSGGSVAAMMRGEMEAPVPESGIGGDRFADRGDRGTDRGAPRERDMGKWGDTTTGSMSAEELRLKLKEQKEAEKKRKQEEEEAAKVAKEAERAAVRQIEGNEKLLVRLKKELSKLEEIKVKEWDELTEEDEAQLEGEVTLREKIANLERQGYSVANLS